jgi:hypothetical protein
MFTQWFMDNAATELLSLAVGGLVVGAVSSVRHRRERARFLAKIADGDDTEIIYSQINLLEDDDQGRPTLRLYNLPGRTTVTHIFRTNPALRDHVLELSEKTSAASPMLDFQDEIGKTSLHEIFNHYSCQFSVLHGEITQWVFAVTCKDAGTFEGKRVRCFLLRPDDLKKLADWEFCRAVRVVYKDHGGRLIELHKIAQVYKKLLQVDTPPMLPRPVMDMMAPLPGKLPFQATRAVDWGSDRMKAALKDAGMPAEQPAPASAE